MSEAVKVAVIVAGAAIIIACMLVYFSPYQTCVRAQTDVFKAGDVYRDAATAARVTCARRTG